MPRNNDKACVNNDGMARAFSFNGPGHLNHCTPDFSCNNILRDIFSLPHSNPVSSGVRVRVEIDWIQIPIIMVLDPTQLKRIRNRSETRLSKYLFIFF